MMGLPAKTRILAVVVILSNVCGNLALSLGLKAQTAASSSSLFLSYIKAFFNPLVLLGVSLLIVWLLSRMALMSWADLSYILPITSIGYVLSAFMGKIFLAEEISVMRWAGTLLIVLGIILVSRTAPRTNQNIRL
ncbi:MAG: hypothetical protein ACRD7E_29795 [Bryobacteraceae bacterium]